MSGKTSFLQEAVFRCVSCGKCCDCGWPVPVTSEEVRRISSLDFQEWSALPRSCFKRTLRGWYLRKQADKRCVFLDSTDCASFTKSLDFPPSAGLSTLSAGRIPLARRFHFGLASLRLSRGGGSRTHGTVRKTGRDDRSLRSGTLSVSGKRCGCSLFAPDSSGCGRVLRRIADSYRNILMYEHIAPEIRFSAAVRLCCFIPSGKIRPIFWRPRVRGRFLRLFQTKHRASDRSGGGGGKDPHDQLVRFRYLIWCFSPR